MTNIPIISVRSISKSFSGRTVLNGFDLDLMPGEIHGLVGQNGSGKSTFIKILSGYHVPDPGGSLKFNNTPVELPLMPTDPASMGMSFVHQDLGLIDSGSILENLRVGRYQTHFGWYISWKNECLLCRQALARFNLDVDPYAKLSTLTHVEKAMVAIVRAIEQIKIVEYGVLVLDEPTSYLPRDDVDYLFTAVREVAAMGHAVVFISHRIEEVLQLTDHVTVIRDGNKVGTFETKDLNEDTLIQYILGFKLEELYPESHESKGQPVFSATEVSGSNVSDFEIEAQTGEIIGLTGLAEMGQEEILYLLFGAQKATSGSICIDNQYFKLSDFSPAKAMHNGLALVPANRLKDGASPTAHMAENITLGILNSFYQHGMLKLREESYVANTLMRDFKVQPMDSEKPFNTFSGGNQQKALLAKWMAVKPKVLLLHEPSQGVDVGARKQIFSLIRKAADSGMTIMIASTEYEDLAALCNRVFVFRDGCVTCELSGSSLTNERIIEQCYRNKDVKIHDTENENEI